MFRDIVEAMTDAFRTDPPDCLVCIESFGYVFGAPMGYLLGSRIVLARRSGKLPRDVHQQGYDMIYEQGKSLEIHESAIQPRDRVLIVDDVLASGGSALAVAELIDRSEAECIGVACLAEVAILRSTPSRLELQSRGIPTISLASL